MKYGMDNGDKEESPIAGEYVPEITPEHTPEVTPEFYGNESGGQWLQTHGK